jgi:hypothetical protein
MIIDLLQLNFIDKTLRQIVTEFEEQTGITLTVTSLYRIKDNGVHGQLPLRGIDCRMKNERIGNVIADIINEKWLYDYHRPWKKCAIFHDTGKGLHIHIQTHPNTKRK